MQNQIPGINNIHIHKNFILQRLKCQVNEYVCNILSSLIAIDYASRIDENTNIDEYTNKCCNKILYNLNNQIIADETFQEAMNLFIIAISNDSNNDETNNLKDNKRSTIINAIIAMNFPECNTPDEYKKIYNLLSKTLEENSELEEQILEILDKKPEILTKIVKNLTKGNIENEKSVNLLKQNINTLNKISQINHNTKIGVSNAIHLSTITASTLITSLCSIAFENPFIGTAFIPSIIASEYISSALKKKIEKPLENKLNKRSNIEQKVKNIIKDISKYQSCEKTKQTVKSNITPNKSHSEFIKKDKNKEFNKKNNSISNQLF